MNEMDMNNRNYDNRGYDNRDYRNYRNYRDDDMDYDYMGYDNRNYRDNYRRDYDRRGGRINNRYRNYREEDYYEELEMTMHEMKETSRKLEDVADMAENQQDKNMLMKIAQKEKENSQYIKQLVEK